MEKEKDWLRFVLFVLGFRWQGQERTVDIELYRRVCMRLVGASVFFVQRRRCHVGRRLSVVLLEMR